MRYGTVCSGVEAFGPAWKAMGYECAFHAEIAPHPSAVLRYHYPDVPNYGDFTTIHSERIDLLCGGTPCQDFSVAGLRKGLAGKRGNLTLEFARLAERLRPRWLVWENVPGVLSADGGRAFGQFLTLLAECGYYAAYRMLDAQHFGIGQRRRRVFVVACSHGWQGGAAVLFNRQSLSGNSAPTPENVYPTLDCNTIGAKWQSNQWCRNGFAISDAFGVRKATPVECERLQGWADDWTKCGTDEASNAYLLPDYARYEIIGNGWHSSVVEWLGQRIKEIDSFLPQVL